MNRPIRNITILAAVLLALILIWVGAARIPGLGTLKETTAATAAVEAELVTAKADQIARIAVHNSLADLTLVPGEVTGTADPAKVTWRLAESQGFPINESALNALAEAALHITYSAVIADDPDDLAAFGLARPASTISLVFRDGSSKTVEFGGDLSSGKGAYARLSSENRIYAVDSRFKEQAGKSLKDLIDTSKANGGLTSADLSQLTFVRRSDGLTLTAACRPNDPANAAAGLTFDVLKPVSRKGNTDTLTSLSNSVLTLTAVNIVDLDAAGLERYGLAEPKYQFTLGSAGNNEVTIRIGDNAGNGQYYMTSSALPAIMTVQASALTALDLPLEDYVDRYVAMQSIWTVQSVTLDLAGEQHEIEIAIEKDQQATDAAARFTLDGRDAKIVSESGSSLFSTFYQTLIGIRLDGFDLSARPDYQPTSRITYTLKPDQEAGQKPRTLVIEFSPRDAYTDFVWIDGEYTGYFVNHEDTFTSDQTGQEGLAVALKHLQYAIDHAVNGVFDTKKGYPADT